MNPKMPNMKQVNQQISKYLQFLTGVQGRKGRSKLKASLFAIIIGLLIGVVPILIANGDPFSAYGKLFTSGFSKYKWVRFVAYGSIFTLLGLGIGVSFKTGLFNIGAAGQFMLAGAVTTMIGIEVHNVAKGLALPLLICIAALVGALFAGIAGLLKAFFNVHEVVSTILLNWIAFFFVKWVFLKAIFRSVASAASKHVDPAMQFNLSAHSYEVWIVVALALMIVLGIWALFKFTTFGFTLKINGLNKDAAKYGGINTRRNTVVAMMISGAIIGVAGFIFYSSVQGQMPELDASLQTWGFEAITVTLLAFSTPLGMPIAGFFYAMMKVSSKTAGIEAGVSNQTISLVLGIIILFAALAPALERLKPLLWTYHHFLLVNDRPTKQARKQLRVGRQMLRDVLQKQKADYELQRPTIETARREIQTAWKQEIMRLNQVAKAASYSLLLKDQKMRAINRKYQLQGEADNLNLKATLMLTYHTKRQQLRRDFKLFRSDRLTTLAAAKGEKWSLL